MKHTTKLFCVFSIFMLQISNSLAYFSAEEFNEFKTWHTLDSDFTEILITQNLGLHIYCRNADTKSPLYFFRSATLRIFSAAEDVKLIKGATPHEVFTQHQSSTWLFWIANMMPWRMRDASFPTFNTSCVGISTDQQYTAKLVVKYIDPWKVLIFVAGVTLYFLSPKLAKSVLFMYSSATLIGAIGAALLLAFLITRAFPRNKASYLTISVLYSVLLFYAGETWTKFEQVFHQRLPYLIVYFTVGALVSILSCYRFGPPSNPKTLNVIQWALQLLGLGLIHLSSDLVEMSTTVIIGLVLYKLLSDKIFYQLKKLKIKLFPTKRKLLTEDEYITQGAAETEKGLEELKKFCNSPDCNAWKMVSRLKDPKRFSGFMDGSCHLNDEEVTAYESENEALDEAAAADLLTDDDENSSNVTDDEY